MAVSKKGKGSLSPAQRRGSIYHLQQQYLQVNTDKIESLLFLLSNRHSKGDKWEQCEDIYNEIGAAMILQRGLLEGGSK